MERERMVKKQKPNQAPLEPTNPSLQPTPNLPTPVALSSSALPFQGGFNIGSIPIFPPPASNGGSSPSFAPNLVSGIVPPSSNNNFSSSSVPVIGNHPVTRDVNNNSTTAKIGKEEIETNPTSKSEELTFLEAFNPAELDDIFGASSEEYLGKGTTVPQLPPNIPQQRVNTEKINVIEGTSEDCKQISEHDWNQLKSLKAGIEEVNQTRPVINQKHEALAISFGNGNTFDQSVSGNSKGINTLGIEKVKKMATTIGHTFDAQRGGEAFYSAHAEKLRALHSQGPIGISFNMCDDCIGYFKHECDATNKPRLFRDNGHILNFEPKKLPVRIRTAEINKFENSKK
jgi:hypothetical protein